MCRLITTTLALLALAAVLRAEDRIELISGTAIYGTVVGEEPLDYIVLLVSGTKVKIEKATVLRIVKLEEVGTKEEQRTVRVRTDGWDGLGIGSSSGRTYYELGTQAASLDTRNSLSITFVDADAQYALAGTSLTDKTNDSAGDQRSLYFGRYSYGSPSDSGWRSRWDLRLMYERIDESEGDFGYSDGTVDTVGEWWLNEWSVTGHELDVNALLGTGLSTADGSWALDGLLGLGVSFAWYSSKARGSFYDPVLTTELPFSGSGDGEYFGFFANLELRGTYFFGPHASFAAAAFVGGKFSHQTIDDAMFDPNQSSAELHILSAYREIGYYTGLSIGAAF